jgi:hypothetical protein
MSITPRKGSGMISKIGRYANNIMRIIFITFAIVIFVISLQSYFENKNVIELGWRLTSAFIFLIAAVKIRIKNENHFGVEFAQFQKGLIILWAFSLLGIFLLWQSTPFINYDRPGKLIIFIYHGSIVNTLLKTVLISYMLVGLTFILYAAEWYQRKRRLLLVFSLTVFMLFLLFMIENSKWDF